MAAMVPRSARMASTGVMVLRRLLEPALSLLRVSDMSVIIVVRTQHSAGPTLMPLETSRNAPGELLTFQSGHFNAAPH